MATETVRVVIPRCDGPSASATPNISESASEKAFYYWEIEDSSLPLPLIPEKEVLNPSEPDRDTSVSYLEMEDLNSSVFIRGQEIGRPVEWQLQLQSVERKDQSPEIKLGLKCNKILQTLPPSQLPIWVRFAYEIVDECGSVHQSNGNVFSVQPISLREGAMHSITLGSKEELQQKREYLSDGKLRFNIRMNIYKELAQPSFKKTEDVVAQPPEKRRRIESPEPSGFSGLLGSLGGLWTTRERTGDVILACREKEIKAHKFILSGQSVVFREMLDCANSMKESDTMKINIPDITPEIIEILLEYLYLGDTTQFDWTNIDHICALIYASDKYLVTSLVIRCFKTMMKLKTFENFGKIAKATFLYNAEKEFRDEVRHFYECNQMSLNTIPSFQNFARMDFDEFYKLFFHRIID